MAVFSVKELTIEIDTDPGGTPTFVEITDMETADIAVEGNVEEWTPLDTAGAMRRLRTGFSQTVTLTGKRNFGDAGNDYVAGLKWAVEGAANTTLKITDNQTVPVVMTMPCVIDVSSILGGDSTAVGSLEFTALSDGEITEA